MFGKNIKIINNEESRQAWFWSFVFIFVFGLFLYGFLVRGAIVNIVARQDVESEISLLNSKILDLESEYIQIKNSITLEKAHDLGFVTVSAQKFVTRNVTNPGLSLITPGM